MYRPISESKSYLSNGPSCDNRDIVGSYVDDKVHPWIYNILDLISISGIQIQLKLASGIWAFASKLWYYLVLINHKWVRTPKAITK